VRRNTWLSGSLITPFWVPPAVGACALARGWPKHQQRLNLCCSPSGKFRPQLRKIAEGRACSSTRLVDEHVEASGSGRASPAAGRQAAAGRSSKGNAPRGRHKQKLPFSVPARSHRPPSRPVRRVVSLTEIIGINRSPAHRALGVLVVVLLALIQRRSYQTSSTSFSAQHLGPAPATATGAVVGKRRSLGPCPVAA